MGVSLKFDLSRLAVEDLIPGEQKGPYNVFMETHKEPNLKWLGKTEGFSKCGRPPSGHIKQIAAQKRRGGKKGSPTKTGSSRPASEVKNRWKSSGRSIFSDNLPTRKRKKKKKTAAEF